MELTLIKYNNSYYYKYYSNTQYHYLLSKNTGFKAESGWEWHDPNAQKIRNELGKITSFNLQFLTRSLKIVK